MEAKPCLESIPTIQKVTNCPRNSSELRLAIQRKRCDVLAKTQTCVPDPNNFVYHCLVNQQKDGFVEVCAPEWNLAGNVWVIIIRNTLIIQIFDKDA